MFSSSMEQERLNSVSRVTKQMKRGAKILIWFEKSVISYSNYSNSTL